MTGFETDLLQILHKLYARRDSELFRDPVPHEVLGLTDYTDIIKKPMCLNTVRGRLEARGERYRNIDEAAFDIRLIWRNSMLYNLPGSKVYVLAQQLSAAWEREYALIARNDADKPPSVEDMQLFAEKCHRLTPEELGTLLGKLDRDCGMCLIKRADVNECEVNVDLMTGTAFKDAMEFIHKIIPDDERLKKRSREDAPSNVKREQVKKR